MSGQGPFALLWGKILRSSIWFEDAETRIVWITLLALKDRNGVVLSTVKGLAHTANIDDVEKVREALAKFKSPDPESSTADDDGRRIRDVSGGWQVINHEKYQFSTEAKRLSWAAAKREYREKKKAGLKVRGKEPLAAALEKAGDAEGALRAEELAAGVTPGTLGGLGDPTVTGSAGDYAADLSERLPEVPADMDPDAHPGEDEFPDPDGPGRFPEV